MLTLYAVQQRDNLKRELGFENSFKSKGFQIDLRRLSYSAKVLTLFLNSTRVTV